MGVAPLTITPTDPPAKFLFPAPMTVYSMPDGQEILVPKGETLPPGDTQ